MRYVLPLLMILLVAAGCSAAPPWPDVPLLPESFDVSDGEHPIPRRVAAQYAESSARPGGPPAMGAYDVRIFDGDETITRDQGYGTFYDATRMAGYGWKAASPGGAPPSTFPCGGPSGLGVCLFSKPTGPGLSDFLVLSPVNVGEGRLGILYIRYSSSEWG